MPESEILIPSDKHPLLRRDRCAGRRDTLAMARLAQESGEGSLNNADVEERLGLPRPAILCSRNAITFKAKADIKPHALA